MDISWMPSGYDPDTSFSLEIKLESYFNKEDGSKRVYVKGKTFRRAVDSERFSLCDFISYLAVEISWGSGQKPKIIMFDKIEGRDVEIVTESQVLDMFSMYKKEKRVLLYVVVSDLDESSKGSVEDIDEPVTVNEEKMYISDCEEDIVHEEVHIDVVEDNVQKGKDNDKENESFVDDSGPIIVHDSGPVIVHDPQNSKIELHALFPDIRVFRKSLRHFSIQKEFKFITLKTDKSRFIGKCSKPGCPWRIHASRLQDSTVVKIKVLQPEHTCPSTSMAEGSMASQSWVSDIAGDWLRKNPTMGPTAVKGRLEDQFRVNVSYAKVWKGKRAAMDQIQGSWEGNFQMLYNFKAEMARICPGSIVEIACTKVGNKMCFSKLFVALKPCIDGFLNGCRPYVGVDSTHLTGKFKGQLAAASSIDGHNWLYPVAYGVFGKESTETWTWFMKQLKKAIGSPMGLVISSDASKGLRSAVVSEFPNCEHRECFRHLKDNVTKKFRGDIFEKHMWPAARAYTVDEYKAHMDKIRDKSPAAIKFLNTHHKQLWSRSMFSEVSKIDYVTNNISECFNSWIRDLKELHVVDLVDGIRTQIMKTFEKRRKVGNTLSGVILPSVMKNLTEKSRNIGKVSFDRGGDSYGQVSGLDKNGDAWRHVVDLDKMEFSCREWQVTGLPCTHAIAFVGRLRLGNLENYVHEYYSVEKFRNAYAGMIPAMIDKSKWVNVDPGFKVHPPLLERAAGRPRKQRIPGVLEVLRKSHKCTRCGKLGHQARTCNEDVPDDSQDVPNSIRTKKRKRTEKKN